MIIYIVIILGGLECRFYEHLRAPTWICIVETFVFQNNLHDTFGEESPCPRAYFVGSLLQAIELHRMHTMQHHKMCTTKTVPHYSLPKSSLLHSLGKGDSHMKISSTKKNLYVRSLKTMMHCTKNNQNPFEKNQKKSWRNVLQNFSYSLYKFRIIRSLESLTHVCTYLWVGRDLGNWWKEPWLVFLGHIVSSNKAWVVQVSLILGL